MGADDFELLTIIGRGAFGEVSINCCSNSLSHCCNFTQHALSLHPPTYIPYLAFIMDVQKFPLMSHFSLNSL